MLKYTVDIVLCIDTTGSMHPVIDRCKEKAISFYEDLLKVMESKNKSIDTLRVKVIAYKDYYFDDDPMNCSRFYELPKEKDEFSEFVNDIEADGGGDEPESGLEALSYAINSDWNKIGDKKRQVIVIWTDASVHQLEKKSDSKPANYPLDIPKNFDDLTDWWEGQFAMNKAAKRLIIFSPDAYGWTDIATNWNNTIHYPSKAGEGLDEIDYKTILDSIAASV